MARLYRCCCQGWADRCGLKEVLKRAGSGILRHVTCMGIWFLLVWNIVCLGNALADYADLRENTVISYTDQVVFIREFGIVIMHALKSHA